MSYNILVDPLRFNSDPFAPSRRRRQIADNVANCYKHMNRTYPIELTVFGLTVNISISKQIKQFQMLLLYECSLAVPFTNYQASVSANTAFGSGNFSSYTNFTTPEDGWYYIYKLKSSYMYFFLLVRGVVINLMGTTRNATSVVLSWDAPPCPNGPIAGYYVYYRQANSIQSLPIDSSQYSSCKKLSTDRSISKIINNLTPEERYSFHIRAFYNDSEPGLVDQELSIKINAVFSISETDFNSVIDRVNIRSQDVIVGLPTVSELSSVGITNIQ